MRQQTSQNNHQFNRRIVFGIGAVFFSLIMVFLIAARFAMASDAEIYVVSKETLDDGGLFFITDLPGKYAPAPLLKTDVIMDISGPVARVMVTQSFTNTTSSWVEGIYTFPLPEKSAVDRLTLVIGERRVEGEIQEKDQARKNYEKAKAEGRRTSLVSQERPNIFTNEIANIGPGETIIVTIEYQDQARYQDGKFEVRFPMVIRPRYIPGNPLPVTPEGSGWSYDSNQVPDASRITPIIAHPANGPINPVSISVNLDPGFAVKNITSPSHEIKIREKTRSYNITLKEEEVPADSDFILQWLPMSGTTPLAGMFSEKIEGDYYHLFMILPRNNVKDAEANILPREVVFIIDVSGSMGGEAIDQAKLALFKGLDGLKPGDTFNIITFNSNAYDVFNGAVPANERNIGIARDFVFRLYADGGTEMASALNIALNGEVGLEHLRQVIFITDGSVGNEEALFSIINRDLGSSRLFTVGIGSAPNSHFMREAAEMGRGTFTYIGNTSEVDEKMNALFHKLETPLLKDISVKLPEGMTGEVFPKNIPDLYDGEPVMVMVKTDKKLKKDITFSGQIAGKEWQEIIDPDAKSKNKGISVLWAREKIRDITKQAIRQGTSRDDETREAITKVALTHQLVSKYTSLIAVDDEIARKGESLKSTPLPTNLPKDMDPGMVVGKQGQAKIKAPPAPVGFGGAMTSSQDLVANSPNAFVDAYDATLPQTATGLWQKLLLGFLFLMGALGMFAFTRQRKGLWQQ